MNINNLKMSKNTIKKLKKAVELYNLIFEKEKYINILNKNIIINDYKLVNFNNNNIIDKFIILVSEKLGENMHTILKICKDIRRSSICVSVIGEVKEPTFTDKLESYYLPLGKDIAGVLRFLATFSNIIGVYNLLYIFFSLTLGSLSYLIVFGQIFVGISRSPVGEYISNISIKKILEHIRVNANRFFEEQGKLHAAVHEHIKV